MFKLVRNIILLILVFLISIYFSYINIKSYFKVEEKKLVVEKNYKNLKIEMNKVLIIGDSRMELINDDKDNLGVPNNFFFKAQSGARIIWFYQVGLPWLKEQIKTMDNNYNYIVLFNLGVNDLNSSTEAKKLAEQYFNIYKEIIIRNKNISFYFLSVNGIDETVIDEYFPNQKRTNKRIKLFNEYFLERIKKENLDNIKYCDSYNTLNIKFYDGLHFDFNTNQIIINYLINDCIKLNSFNTFSIKNIYKFK